jgi:hypothetical protein
MASQPKTVAPSDIGPTVRSLPARRLRPELLAPLLFLAIALAAQIVAGSYRAEFTGYSDESGHVVTGLALEQYVLHPFTSPFRFFKEYYEHYPRVALGHWPPLLYVAEAGAMLIGSPSRYSLLGLQAVLAAMIAWMLFRELRPLVGTAAALLGGAAFLLTPEVRLHTSMAMAEMLLTLTMFLACLAFVRFADSGRLRDAVWFGVWTSAAVLTKPTGWAVLMVPAAVVAITWKWRLPFHRSLRLPALIIAVLCLPWQILTLGLASEGWGRKPGLQYSLWALPQFTELLFTVPGILIAIAAVVGAAGTLVARRDTGRSRSYWAAMVGLALAAWLFHILVPAGVESRKLIILVPAMFVLAGAGAVQLSRWLLPRYGRAATGAIFACIALCDIALALPVQPKARVGFTPVAAELERIMPPGSAALIAAGMFDEGLVISEVAIRHPDPSVYLLRGSKLLASVDWNGLNYRGRVHSADDCNALLSSVPVGFIVLNPQAKVRFPYFDYLAEMLREHSADWTLVGEFPITAEHPYRIAIYRRSGAIAPAHNLPAWMLPPVPLAE